MLWLISLLYNLVHQRHNQAHYIWCEASKLFVLMYWEIRNHSNQVLQFFEHLSAHCLFCHHLSRAQHNSFTIVLQYIICKCELMHACLLVQSVNGNTPEAANFFFSFLLWHNMASLLDQEDISYFACNGWTKSAKNKWTFGLSNIALLQKQLRWEDMRGLHSVSAGGYLKFSSSVLRSLPPYLPAMKTSPATGVKMTLPPLILTCLLPLYTLRLFLNASSLILELLLRGCFVFCCWACDSMILITKNICCHR